jgi:nicotinate-nucleotide pyrophosphorylase (carboxylating)
MTLSELVRLSFAEDLGPGDLTTTSCVDPAATGTARVVAKQDLVVSGLDAARETFGFMGVSLEALVQDGDRVSKGAEIVALSGPLAGILQAERVALNFLMRLCGIATHTASVVGTAQGKLRVVCTRKTTPLHRSLEKAAVRHGGGHNHRHGLYDGVMIKDNHIIAAGGIAQAVARARAGVHHLVKVEVEVEDLDELGLALEAGADVILLDNMDDDTLAEAVRLTAGRAVLEASGNMDAARIEGIRDLGLDVVSVGGLIHQARWVDLSLRIDPR